MSSNSLMSYAQSNKTTDLERKLQLIKTQLYGKGDFDKKYPPKEQVTTISGADTSYLRSDLYKTMFLASCILFVQILLFLLVNKNLIKF